MKTDELIKLHKMNFGPDYLPNPDRHIRIKRDYKHYQYSFTELKTHQCKTVLDIGCFDGWLDFLLVRDGYSVTGIELIQELVDAANRYAERNFFPYRAHQGRFLDMSMEIDHRFDVVMCYETLEHVDFQEVQSFIEKMESLSDRLILISLPDQKHEDNPQHQWTPTDEIIERLFGEKRFFMVERYEYKDGVPSNWFISYEI